MGLILYALIAIIAGSACHAIWQRRSSIKLDYEYLFASAFFGLIWPVAIPLAIMILCVKFVSAVIGVAWDDHDAKRNKKET